MKKILVLGCSGFTGKHFINYVKNNKLFDNYKFYGIDFIQFQKTDKHLKFFRGDCTDKSFLKKIISDISPEYIINFIGKIRGSDISDFNKINVEIPYIILETAKELKNLKKILLIGSAAEYGIPENNPLFEEGPLNPVNLYGLSKVYQTELADYSYRINNVPVVIGRTFNIKGEGLSPDLAIGNFMKQIDEMRDGNEMQVGNLATYRDYMDVEEVVDQYWNILLNGKPGEIYNVCSGKPQQMSVLLDEIIKKSGKKISIKINEEYLKKNDVEMIYGSNDKYKAMINSIKIR